MLYNKILSPRTSDNKVNVWKKDKAARAVSSFGMHYSLHDHYIRDIPFCKLVGTLLCNRFYLVFWLFGTKFKSSLEY